MRVGVPRIESCEDGTGLAERWSLRRGVTGGFIGFPDGARRVSNLVIHSTDIWSQVGGLKA